MTSTFQKRHYEATAAILRKHIGTPDGNTHDYERGQMQTADNIVTSFADLFEEDNENFDRDRFFTAVYQ